MRIYRLSCELEPLHRWYWWLVERSASWPTKAMWLRKAEDGVRELADEHDVSLMGDPIGTVEHREKGVVVHASALGSGRDDLPAAPEIVPLDIVDRPRSENPRLHDLDDVAEEFGVDLDDES